MRRLAATLLTGLVVAPVACATEKALSSGLRGVVLRGPTQPVCVVGEPCDEPAPGVTLVFSHAGKEIARTRTSGDGRFRVTLRPGRYAVRTTRPAFERRVEPALVTVPTGRYARITLRIDTGIR